MKTAGGDRDRARRPDLPRRHCRPRTRGAGLVGGEGGQASAQARAMVTVSCAEGEVGSSLCRRYSVRDDTARTGGCRASEDRDHAEPRQSGTGVPSAMLPNDGVGLARMEFIISEHIRIHPMALAHPEKVSGSDP